MKRCFVAMTIADSTRDQLAALGRMFIELPRSAARRVRPVKAENLHVTIKFLGDVPDEQIGDIIASLTAVAASATRAHAFVAGLGAFPSNVRPRVVFADLGRGRDALTRLCTDVAGVLEPLGFAPERRPPHPHVTLARVEGTTPRGPLTRWLEELPAEEYGPVADEALILYESQLTAHGAIYQPLATLPVGAA